MAENTKKWEETGRRYRTYIKLEKRLSENTVESYMRDLRQFAHFILRQYDVTPRKVERTMIERYMGWLFERGREKTSLPGHPFRTEIRTPLSKEEIEQQIRCRWVGK